MDANEAKKLFEQALEAQRAGRHGEAAGGYREILASYPGHGDAWSNLGIALKMMGDLDGAIEAFSRAIELGAGGGGVYAYLGHALRDAGRLEEAVAAYRRGVEVSGDSRIADSLLVALHAHPGYGRWELFEEHRKWARQFFGGVSIDGRSQFSLTPARSGAVANSPRFSRRERGNSGRALCGGVEFWVECGGGCFFLCCVVSVGVSGGGLCGGSVASE